jgi:predicted RNA-binding Zn-ribbon protein involved in translation (DUF1610 family)
MRMEGTTSSSGDYLQFGCPRCGYVVRDEYETLNAGAPTDWRCDNCDRIFNVLLLNCEYCGFETTSLALIAAEQAPTRLLVCRGCQRPAIDHEEVDDAIF